MNILYYRIKRGGFFMSKDTVKILKRVGRIAGGAAAAFALIVILGAVLMQRGTIGTELARAVLSLAIMIAAITALAIWRAGKGNSSKRRKR